MPIRTIGLRTALDVPGGIRTIGLRGIRMPEVAPAAPMAPEPEGLWEGFVKPTAREAGKYVVATPEAVYSVLEGMIVWPISKIAGLGGMVAGGEEMKRREEAVARWLTHKPFMPETEETMEIVGKGFELAETPQRMAADDLEAKGHHRAAYLVKFVSDLAMFKALHTGGVKAKAKVMGESIPKTAPITKEAISQIAEIVPTVKEAARQRLAALREEGRGFEEFAERTRPKRPYSPELAARLEAPPALPPGQGFVMQAGPRPTTAGLPGVKPRLDLPPGQGFRMAGPYERVYPEAVPRRMPTALPPGQGFVLKPTVKLRRRVHFTAVEAPKEYPPIYEKKGKLVGRRPPTPEEIRVREAKMAKMEGLRKKAIIEKEVKPKPEAIAKDLDLIYNGPQEIVGGKMGYLFTDQKTGSSFTVRILEKAEVRAGLEKVRARYEKPPTLKPTEAEAPTLEFLGFQTTYETASKWLRSARAEKSEATKAVVKKIRDEYLTPVKGSPLDRAAVAFLRSDKLADYFKEMPALGEIRPSEVMRFDPTAQKYIATITTKAGKIKPAIRQSGFHVLKDFADYADGLKDITKLDAMWSDPTRIMQAIDQGKFGGMVQKHVLWPARLTTLTKIRWADIQKTKLASTMEKYNINSGRKKEAAGDVVEYISGRDAWGWSIDKILKDKKVQGFLKKFKPEAQREIVQAAATARKLFDNWRDNQNHARRLRKQKEIPRRSFYRPWIIKANLWARLKGLKQKPKEIMESPEMPDFIFPDRPFNPRAEARTGLLKRYPKERNLEKLMSDYVETAARDIFDTNVVHSNKIHTAVLRSKGLENSAAAIDTWTAEVFAGVKPRLTRFVAETVPPPMRMAMRRIRRGLTRAVFPLNWTWNMFIQTSSSGLTYMRYGTRANFSGLGAFANSTMRQAIKQNAYSHILKSRFGGRAVYQDVQSSILRTKRLDATKIETIEDYANFMTQAVESTLTDHAIAAAHYDGRIRLGLKGRELWEYASEGGAKTQSMYNYQDTPGILRAREVGQIGPFQTFAIECFNTVREMNIPVLRRLIGKTGAYETINANSVNGKALMSKRLMMLGRWTAAIVVTNAVVDRAIGRKPWEPSSFIPFFSLIFGGFTARGPAATRPLPQQYIQDFYTGVRDVIVYESFKKLRRWYLRYHVTAGFQWNRMLDGIEAVSKGKVSDVRGRRLFSIKGTGEEARAISMGPYRTKAGREYIKKRKKTQGIIGAFRASKKVPLRESARGINALRGLQGGV